MKELDTSELGPIRHTPPKIDSLYKLLRHVNELNTDAEPGVTFWSVVLLYNTVVWRRDAKNNCTLHEIYSGVLK